MSSTLPGTMLTWVCGHECFWDTGIDSLFLETFTWDLVSPAASLCTWESSPGARVLKLLLYLAEGEEKVLLHGVSFSKTKPIKRHTSHMEEVFLLLSACKPSCSLSQLCVSWRPLSFLCRPQLSSSRLTHLWYPSSWVFFRLRF